MGKKHYTAIVYGMYGEQIEVGKFDSIEYEDSFLLFMLEDKPVHLLAKDSWVHIKVNPYTDKEGVAAW